MKRAFAAGLACLMVAGCQTSTALAPPTPAYRDLGPTIQNMGYDELLLPSTAYGPGLLVTSSAGAGGVSPPLQLAYICSPLYTAAPPPLVDPAASAQTALSLNGAFNVDATVLKAIGLGAKADYVETVTLSLSDVTVEQLALADLEAIVDTLGPKCKGLLNKYRNQGIAYQTLQAVRATVTYQVTFKQGASAEVKNAVIRSLGLSVGANVQSTGDSSVAAKGLYLGLKLKKVGA
ncbi:hypothetical protein J5J86_03720 [Aquabacter sp. L1I39]|uniref:hypothetical protein n=1 Tax=Aquabacter sp. L1I39 TaxID=2820278 RepID=UPI001ADA2752|nr:hypothetical protein [Aquabacter sp. L1I39]QTL04460.1 hypothetical protein J5J86_03720 [Aquabacter sp. L1I39]